MAIQGVGADMSALAASASPARRHGQAPGQAVVAAQAVGAQQAGQPVAAGPAPWAVAPLPGNLQRLAADHARSGHQETGVERAALTGWNYRTYLDSLTEQELAVEAAMTQMSCLTKLRQLEHSLHFLEDRVRQAASLPHERLREFQQAGAALSEAQDNADLAEQAAITGAWAVARHDTLVVNCRGGCLAGIYGLWWAMTHWTPRH